MGRVTELPENARDLLVMLVASERFSRLSTSDQAQAYYELQRRGLVVESGCCGVRRVTDEGHATATSELLR
jgi:hypothetical protein